MKKTYIIAGAMMLLFNGCVKDVTNTIGYYATETNPNKIDLSGFGYKNNRYQNLNVGNLNLKVAKLHHKVKASDVKVLYNIPSNCKEIGYITLENPKGLPFGSGFKIGTLESESSIHAKRFKKAASLQGVSYIADYSDGSPEVKDIGKYYLAKYKNSIVLHAKGANRGTIVRESVKAYDCK